MLWPRIVKETALFLLLAAPALHAQFRFETADGTSNRYLIAVPYVLSSDSLGVVGGVGFGTNRLLNDQSTIFGTIYGSTNDSYLFLLGTSNLWFGGDSRWFLDGYLSVGRTTERRLFFSTPPTPVPPGYPRPGSNDSSDQQYRIEDVWEGVAEIKFKYVLPIGDRSNAPIHTYKVRQGILVENPANSGTWNPLKSGRSVVSIHPAYREQYIEVGPASGVSAKTMNIRFEYLYDNSDFEPNPMNGSKTRIRWTQDFGILGNDPWSSVDADVSKFIPLPLFEGVDHHVLALNAWTAYSPSWDETFTGSVNNAPPYFEAATLGGFFRLRGFNDFRFYDRAAIHYAAEYRIIPSARWPGFVYDLSFLSLKWIQYAAIFEVGRVAPDWNPSELHSDMKWNVGLGIRAMFGQGVGRLDFCHSGENAVRIVAMISQAF